MNRGWQGFIHNNTCNENVYIHLFLTMETNVLIFFFYKTYLMLANQSIDFVLDISLANMHLPFAIQGAALQLHEVRLK